MKNKELINKRKSSKLSVGEKIISEYLRKARVKFIREHHHPDLTNDITGNLLFFDFYLPRLNVVIEVDGRQHYEAYNGDEKKLRDQQYRDDIKNQFCVDRNIKMLRLTYADLRPPMTKVSDCLGTCIDDRKHIHKKNKKEAKRKKKKVAVATNKKKKKVVLSYKQYQEAIKRKKGERVKRNNESWLAGIERKRNEARLKYPADVRIYLAENNKLL